MILSERKWAEKPSQCFDWRIIQSYQYSFPRFSKANGVGN